MKRSQFLGRSLPGGYRIERFVASGGFAWVYEGRRRNPDTGTPERCAIKIPFDRSPEARKRFEREIKVLRELPPNPHCVHYLADGVVEPGLPFLAMEFIDGVTLASAMQRRRVWPERDACEVMRQLCVAYAAQHRLGIANRDVKPENVMLTRAHGAKVLDFGLIKDAQGLLRLFEEEDLYTGQRFAENIDRGVLAGSPDFMAPEQLTDSALDVSDQAQTDTWSDVYSLGLIFYRLLTGRRLFRFNAPRGAAKSDYARALLAYVRERLELRRHPVPRPTEIRPELWLILEQALRSDPRQRYPTAESMGRDIVQFIAHGRVDRRPDEITSVADVGTFLAAHLMAGSHFMGENHSARSDESRRETRSQEDIVTSETKGPRRRKPPPATTDAWSGADPWAATEAIPEDVELLGESEEDLPTRIALPKANAGTSPPASAPPIPIDAQRTKPISMPQRANEPRADEQRADEPMPRERIESEEIATHIVPRPRNKSSGWFPVQWRLGWPIAAVLAVAGGLTWLLGVWP